MLSIPRGRVKEDVRPFDFRQWRSIKGLTVPGEGPYLPVTLLRGMLRVDGLSGPGRGDSL